jgi:tetratricopeptide (TPR) repeat protein
MALRGRPIAAARLLLAGALGVVLAAAPAGAETTEDLHASLSRLVAGDRAVRIANWDSRNGSAPSDGGRQVVGMRINQYDRCESWFMLRPDPDYRGDARILHDNSLVWWREVSDLRRDGTTVSWSIDRDRRSYRVSLSSAGAAGELLRIARMLAAACREPAAPQAAPPAPPAPAPPSQPPGDEQALRAECTSRTAAPQAIVAACTTLEQRWLRETLKTGERPAREDQFALHNNRGLASIRTGDLEAAARDAEAAIALAPADWRGHSLRGTARGLGGDHRKAIVDWDEALRLAPNEPVVLIGRANSLIEIGREREALAAADRAVAVDPRNAGAQNLACWIRVAYHGAELDRARRHCDEAVRLAPGRAAYLDSRALVHLKQQRWREAWADYDLAVRNNPAGAHPLFGRGVAALRLGRPEGLDDLVAARRLDPGIDDTYARYSVVP